MTTNRLAKPSEDRLVVPSDREDRIRFWIDKGNRQLWGLEPTSKGEWLPPQTHLHWVWRNGDYSIEHRGK